MTTKQLQGRRCQIVLKLENGRNYITSALPARKRKSARPQPEPQSVDLEDEFEDANQPMRRVDMHAVERDAQAIGSRR